ncbi:hypothetical protein Bca52824_036325 [Brassica carinata]|uniref:Legume lectin domain-containing protein n=1 Tax=Brassica carinata TaxID=52824 RepID=A0A8X7S5S7_BRACI|nr:hypothetical protein Bca52824_036325 [Brassica carinata]
MHRSVLREDLHIRSRLFYSSSAKGRGLLQILIISSLHLVCLSSQQETRFVYESFLHPKNLYLDGSAKVLPDGQLQLTNTSASQIGHAFYKKPIQFSSSGPLTFSTHFVCALVPKQGHEGGHGLAFLLSSSIDFSHAQATRYVGTFNASTNGSHVLAVELDTIWNPEFNDVDNNHVGIDVNNPVSVGVASASYCSDKKRKNESMNLLSGKPIQKFFRIDQDFSLDSLQATGNAVSDHCIIWWSFSTNRGSLQPLDISRLLDILRLYRVPYLTAPHKKKLPPTMNIILLVCLGIVVLAVLAGVYFHRRKKYSEVSKTWEKEFDAHRFSYKFLYKATKGFSKDEFL